MPMTTTTMAVENVEEVEEEAVQEGEEEEARVEELAEKEGVEEEVEAGEEVEEEVEGEIIAFPRISSRGVLQPSAVLI